MRKLIFGAVSAIALVGPAAAADIPVETVPVPDAVEARDIIIDIGAGAVTMPAFPAASRYTVNPWPIADLQFLRLPFFGEVVSGEKASFYVYPSFDYYSERDDADAHYLAGIDDVDASFMLGAGAAFEYRFVKTFAEVRYGVSGNNGFIATFGADLQYEAPRWSVAAGPRVELASANFMDTYFSVPDEARRLRPFKADAGILDAGIALKATYAITDKWRIQAQAEWTHYLGDAEESPITKKGDEDAFMVGLGLTYRFGADLY